MLQSGLAATFAGENRGVAQAFGFHKLCVCVVISLPVFYCVLRMNVLILQLEILILGVGFSVTVLCFAVSLWFVANFVFRRNMQACAPGVWPSLTYLFSFTSFCMGFSRWTC